MKFRYILAAVAAASAILFVQCNSDNKAGDDEEEEEEEEVVDNSLIKIDGDFSDWAGLEGVSVATLPDGEVAYSAMKVFKACADEFYIYLYFEMDCTNLAVMDLFIDLDNSNATGQTANWPATGAEVLLQSSFDHTLKIPASIYNPIVRLYGGEPGGTEWTWIDDAGMNFTTTCVPVKKTDEIICVEMRMIREMMSLEGLQDSFSIGAIIENSNWTIIGKLPCLTEAEKAGEDAPQEAGLRVNTIK